MSHLDHPKTPVRASRRRHLIRGAANVGVLGRYIVAGFVLIGVGVACKGQAWTQPELLKPMGLDLAITITNMGIFLAFAGVINVFYYTPFKESMDARNHELEATFTEAENLKKEMAELRTSYEARLAATEAEAREQIQAQIREAQHLRQTLMAEAAARADDLLRKAELETEAEKQRVMGELRSHVVDLTFNATERLIGEKLDSATNRRLVEQFIDNMAVPSGS